MSKLFHDVTMFVLLYSGYQLIQDTQHLASDVTSNISKHFPVILSVKQQIKAIYDEILPYKEILDFGEVCLLILHFKIS